MEKILLMKVITNTDDFRSIRKEIEEHYIETGKLLVEEEAIIKNCEQILLNGKPVYIDLDMKKLDDIVFSDDEKYKNKYNREAELSIYFSKAFEKIPMNVMYDSNVWTYLNMVVLRKYVEKLYFSTKAKNPCDRISRCLFNLCDHSKMDRTGMRFLWYMGVCLELTIHPDRALVAFEFIDPVKAVAERKMSCNNMILRAFVEGIMLNDKNPLLKNDELRKIVPYHISCYTGVRNLDGFDYDELVSIIAKEQKRILNLYNVNVRNVKKKG